jgi:hypothetical protein
LKGATVLFSEMSPDLDWEDDFNHWYDTHLIPTRLAVPGFVSAQRYRDAERPNYLSIFELTGPDVFDTPAYLKVKNQPNAKSKWMLANVQGYSRYLGNEISQRRRDDVGEEAIDAPFLYAVFFSVPDERVDEFNRWYEEEHVAMLLRCKDWLMVRRFEVYESEPQPWTHLALHYIASLDALKSPQLEAARTTEWRDKLAAEAWFRGSYVLFERLGDRFAATA